MKIFININQKAFVDLSLSRGIDLDLVDATIFEYIVNFSCSNNSYKKLIGNKLFVWVSYQKIIDDNPLIRIGSKRAILNRLNNLEKAGILEKIVDKESGNKTFFNITDLAYKSIINTQEISNQNSESIEPKCDRVSNQNSIPLRKNGSTNSMLNNRELNIASKKIYKKENNLDYTFDDFWELVPKYHKKDSRKCKLIFDRISKDKEFPKTFDGIRKALIPYITKVHFKYPYIKNMNTWLNSGNYADEWSCETLANEISKQETTPRVRRGLEEYVKEFVNNFEQGIRYENEKVI